MSKGKIVKEINRQLIRTKDSIHFDIYAPRDKQVLAEQLSYKEAEDYCRKHTEYVAYPVSEKSKEYLSRYITLTEELLLAIGKHAMRYILHGDICAYYTDIEDFMSDWTGIGYTRTEARSLMHEGTGEFFKLPNNLGYVRFTI